MGGLLWWQEGDIWTKVPLASEDSDGICDSPILQLPAAEWPLAGLIRKEFVERKYQSIHRNAGESGPGWWGTRTTVWTVLQGGWVWSGALLSSLWCLGTPELPRPLGGSSLDPISMPHAGHLICSSWWHTRLQLQRGTGKYQPAVRPALLRVRRQALPPENSHSRLLHSEKTQLWDGHQMMYVNDKC